MTCQHCGDCCRYVALRVNDGSVAKLEMHDVPLNEQECGWVLIINKPCKWRDEEAQRCRNYDERPVACRDYLCEKAREGGG